MPDDVNSPSDQVPVGGVPAVIDRRLAALVADSAIGRYADARRARIPDFVDRHFSLAGSLHLHRHAFGLDVIRAPLNLLLAGPQLALMVSGAGLRLAAQRSGSRTAAAIASRVEGRRLFLRTDVAAELEWLLWTELLELPFEQIHPTRGRRVAARDALAEALLGDPRIENALQPALSAIEARSADPIFRERLTDLVATYTSSRAAASDIASSLLSLSIGAVALRQMTPGLLTLGPAVAGALANHIAVAGFPLGAGLGSLWYSLFPVSPAPLFIAGITGSMFLAAAGLSAFSGILTDPVERRLGLHRRRLEKLVAAIEANLTGEGPTGLKLRDHYVARLIDLLDLLRSIQRLAQ